MRNCGQNDVATKAFTCKHPTVMGNVCRDLGEEMRSHKDLAKDSAPHFAKAKKFYAGVAAELASHGHTLDMFACALDQVSMCVCLCRVYVLA